MQLRDDAVAVAVPATSANLGPGFDSMGLALDLWDEIYVHATAGGPTVVEVLGEGADSVDHGEDHLVVRALRMTLDYAGAPQVGIRMRCKNRIPHSRGLGSSAAAIVAGITLARGLIGDPHVLAPADVLQLAISMENHPDNLAPAIYGGATVAWMDRGTPGAVRLSPPGAISPVVFIPDYELPTSAARAALSSEVSRADAIHNLSRSALLTALLSGTVAPAGGGDFHDLLMTATADTLHQEQRRAAMPASVALVDWLRASGMPAVISGAGPAVLCFEPVSEVVRRDAVTAGWQVLSLPVATQGARLTRGRLAAM